MGYKVELLIDERISGVGHAFLRLTNDQGEVMTRGFYPDEGLINQLFSLPGYAKATIMDDSNHPFTRSRIFNISKEQYDTMVSEIAYIENRVKVETTTYDLFDGDSGVSDFNCVTFSEYILNTAGIDVELGLIPHIALSSSYANEFGETYYDNLSVHAGDGKPGAMVSYTNGYVLYTDGSWEHHTTKPSYSITTSYDDTNKTLKLDTNHTIEDEGFAKAFLGLTNETEVQQITLNTQTYDVVSENNKLLIRNAIDDIPKVSFLLSHIDIDVGDILDIGDQGLYSVKGGDTMSEIAQDKGMTTQALLKLNTWLIDEGKVHFDQDINLLTCKDFKAIKSLHVRMKIKQKGATYGAEQKGA